MAETIRGESGIEGRMRIRRYFKCIHRIVIASCTTTTLTILLLLLPSLPLLWLVVVALLDFQYNFSFYFKILRKTCCDRDVDTLPSHCVRVCLCVCPLLVYLPVSLCMRVPLLLLIFCCSVGVAFKSLIYSNVYVNI